GGDRRCSGHHEAAAVFERLPHLFAPRVGLCLRADRFQRFNFPIECLPAHPSLTGAALPFNAVYLSTPVTTTPCTKARWATTKMPTGTASAISAVAWTRCGSCMYCPLK